MNTILSALVNGAIMSVLVTSVVALAMRALPRRLLNAATRYVIWWAALVMTIAMFAWYLPRGDTLRSSPERSARKDPGQPQRTVGSEVATPASKYSTPSVRADLNFSPPIRLKRPLFPLEVAVGRWAGWIVSVWLLAALLMLTRLTVSCVLLERRKARAFGAPPLLAVRAEEWLKQCGSQRRRARLACSTEIATPLAAGLWAASILIPSRLLPELTEDELDQIGLHEATHLARGDDYALILQRILEALFVLHPVVHWITRRIDLEREIACDDVVVEVSGRARSYAACLTRVVDFASRSRALRVAVAVAEKRSHLATRVEVLLQKSRQGAPHVRVARLTGAIAALAVVAWAAAMVPGVVTFSMPMPARQTSSGPPITTTFPLASAERPAPVLEALQRPPSSPRSAPALQLSQNETNVPAGVRVVPIPVTVTDPSNRFVTGLEKEHFRIFEDGVEQEISQVSGEDAPLSIGIVFDISASTAAKIEQARAAVFLKGTNPQDEFFLVQSKDRAQLIHGFTTDIEAIQWSLSSSEPGGRGALLGAVLMATDEMKKAHNLRKAILIISDAGDENGRYTEREVKNAVREADAQVYAIEIGIFDPFGFHGRLLAEFAELTEGRSYHLHNLSELADITTKIGIELHNQYVLYYTPKNQVRDGAYRHVLVELVQPRGLPPLKASFQRGYYAPVQ